MASKQELSDFLKDCERRAFRRAAYQVRDDEAALDIVQDSMIKLAKHYGDKPAAELPPLFARILANTILDWFRANKKEKAVFSHYDQWDTEEDDSADALETLESADDADHEDSGETQLSRKETLKLIEKEIEKLPDRQREAFLLRYWEELDVAQTAAAMGCTEGSVKTHCSRACHTLSKALMEKGITL